MQLGLSQADAARNIENLLDQARKRDDAMADRLKELGNKFEDFVRRETQHQQDIQRQGQLMVFFTKIADELAAKGAASPWLHSGPDFRSLVQTLKGDRQREMLKDLRTGVGASKHRIELIKNQTVVALDEMFKILRDLPPSFREQESVKSLLEKFDEQRQRVQELVLTVGMIGPTKSGKTGCCINQDV